ncbi:hypothetical protein BGW80DRAFT_1560786 [Lactifluus volemus]|nr:hypothetical protein BGW80DRAFT_1560786 [Lactifluus volemus]
MQTPLPPLANESSISMVNCFPLQDPRKVIVILLDKSCLLFMVWDQIPGLCRELFVDPSGSTPKPLVGYVVCGPSGTNSSPVLIKPFAEDGHELLGHPSALGIGGSTTETTSGMSILEGYAAAIETNAEHKELFSYHLWHVAAEKPDGNMHPIWNNTPALDSLTWETLLDEVEKRNINYLMRVVQPSPAFEVFDANSGGPATPWFDTIPLDLSLSQRSDDRWSGILHFRNTVTALSVPVYAIDSIGNPRAKSWPFVLSLELIGPAVSIIRLQEWMRDKESVGSVAMRFRPALENDDDYSRLIQELRLYNCYAVASWEIPGKGHPTRNLLIRPLRRHLLGVAFPDSEMPRLPVPNVQQQPA